MKKSGNRNKASKSIFERFTTRQGESPISGSVEDSSKVRHVENPVNLPFIEGASRHDDFDYGHAEDMSKWGIDSSRRSHDICARRRILYISANTSEAF